MKEAGMAATAALAGAGVDERLPVSFLRGASAAGSG